MTSHELALKLLAGEDKTVLAFDPDSENWEEVSCYTDHPNFIRLYTDDIS